MPEHTSNMHKRSFPKRKRVYFDTCKTKMAWDYCVRKLSVRFTRVLAYNLYPMVIVKKNNILAEQNNDIYIYIYIHIYT